MHPLKLEKHEAVLLNEIAHDINELKIAVQLMREKQETQSHRHEGIKAGIAKLEQKVENRLHDLDKFMHASLQRLSTIKSMWKFWPVLLAVLVMCFAFGAVVDDKAVATKIVNTVEDKGHELI